MKKLLLFILFCITINSYSQLYQLDETFADNGTKYILGNFVPLKGKFYQNNYYILGYTQTVNRVYQIHKINYNGSYDTTFGTNGIMLLNLPPNDTTIIGMEVSEENVYVFGKRQPIGHTDSMAFILKITTTGNVDVTFGIDGLFIANFSPVNGMDYTISSIKFLDNGLIYCVGTRDPICCSENPRLIYFRVVPDGTVDYSFDETGYKVFPGNFVSYGNEIVPYQNGFLLIGSSRPLGIQYPSHTLLLVLVDESGNLIDNFGTNGYKMVNFQNFLFLSEVTLFGDKLYFTYVDTANTFQIRIGVYDIATTLSLLSINYNSIPTIAVNAEGLWYSGANANCSIECENTFNLARRTLNGEIDPTFLNSIYSYNSFTEPTSYFPRARTRVIIPDTSGNIVLAGNATNLWQSGGFAMLRLKTNVLGVGKFNFSSNIYPNPFVDRISIEANDVIKKAEIFDISGRVVLSQSPGNESRKLEIDLSCITSKGVYLAVITTSGNVASKLIIKN